MPKSTTRGKRVKAYVELSGGVNYGFLTSPKIFNSYGADLGQADATGVTGVFFGANSPKPSKATKKFPGGQVSSYCSTSKIDELKDAGWYVIPGGRTRGVSKTAKTQVVAVDMPGGYKYAWRINDEDISKVAPLGLEIITASSPDLIFGSTPKPPIAAKLLADGNFSTFCKPSKATIDALLAAGWSVQSVDYLLNA